MLILIAHGSRDSRWRASVESVIESLQDQVGRDRVRLAYMECTPPTLIDVAGEAREAGVDTLRILPLFLTGEGHVARNIVPLVDQLRDAHGNVKVELLPPIGQHPLFLDVLAKIAKQEED
jgi:sirohydrochlorin cobaltochelatase